MKACPYCAESIQDAAVLCRYCGKDLEPRDERKCWSCGAEARSFDSTCHRCGERLSPIVEAAEPAKPTVATGPVASIIGSLLVLLVALWFFGVLPGQFSDSEGRTVMPSSVISAPPVVTKAEYDALQNGISYERAVEIIGARGDELSRSDLAGISTVMYSWMNSNGSNMNAMFQNGRLIQKAQFGLPD